MGVPNPEGWQRVAGGRSVAQTSGSARIVPRIPEGCQRSATPAGSVRISRPPFGGIAPAFASLRRGESLNPRLTFWQAFGLLRKQPEDEPDGFSQRRNGVGPPCQESAARRD